MRSNLTKLTTMGALIASSFVALASPAEARHHRRHYASNYNGRTYYAGPRCRRSRGDAGLIAGGVGGALLGSSVLGHGLLGTAAGGVGGAFAGRAIDRTLTARNRCR